MNLENITFRIVPVILGTTSMGAAIGDIWNCVIVGAIIGFFAGVVLEVWAEKARNKQNEQENGL